MRVEANDMSLANAAQIAELGIEAIHGGDASFDLSAVRTCDSSALAVLLTWQREAQAAGHRIELSGVPDDMKSLATVYGIDGLLPIAETAGP